MKFAVLLCSFLTGCVILIAFVWDSIEGELANSGPRRKIPSGGPYPGDKVENIFWFIQVTDVHVSRYWDANRAPDLARFLKEHVTLIKPDLVVASGDLTDAKTVDHQGSRQYEDEWQAYRKAIQDSGILRSTVWLDIRGNHDAFDVTSLDSKQNFFRKYSVKGSEHSLSYGYELKKSFGSYYFNGVDACPNPGPKRPFNFFGYMPEERVHELDGLELASQKGNMTIWFGHYPTSTIVVDKPGLRRILGGGIAYLCGHLHTLGNLVPKMYTHQYAGYLELELGDWKDNRIYRVLAVDHDMFSFTDESLDHWPIVLITNPKNALFQVPTKEPLHRISKSTHVRMLIFSPWPIKEVTVMIDDVYLEGVYHAGKGLYVVPWNPEKYAIGLHKIAVKALDNEGNFKSVSHSFSLDRSRPNFTFLPSLILMSHIDTIGMMLFALGCLSVIIPLYVQRRNPHLPRYSSRRGLDWLLICVYKRIKWIWLASHNDYLYYSLVSFTLYVAVGPWFLGHLLYDHLGLVFSWGIFIKSSFIPGSITYFYGLFQMVTFNMPLMFHLGYALDYNNKKGTSVQKVVSWRRDWFLAWLIIFQAYMAYGGFYLAYGGVALLLCPVRTWSVFFALVLHLKVIVAPEKYITKVTEGQYS